MTRLDTRWAKGGQYTKPGRAPIDPGGTAPSTSTPQLAFDLDLSANRGTKMLMAHEFPVYPRMEGDYWTLTKTADGLIPASLYGPDGDYLQKHQMWPGREEGVGQSWYIDHRKYGGKIHNRLIPRTSALGIGDPAYRVRDMEWQIQSLVDSGWDGSLIDILQARDQQRGIAVTNYVTAMSNVAPSWFKLGLMPDGTSGFCKGRTPEAVADDLAAWINQAPGIHWQIDGKYVIAPYGPEGVASTAAGVLAFWTAVKNRLKNTYGIDILFWFCYTADWLGPLCAPALDSIAYGHGRWGTATPFATAEAGNRNAGAPAYCHATYAKPWMHFARPQDNRPEQVGNPVWWEAGGTDLIRACFDAAIAGAADAIQGTTFNDFYEASGFGPSVRAGHCWLDIIAYRAHRYKKGSFPTILRDTTYLIHRNQFTTVDTTAEILSPAQTIFMAQQEASTEPARNEIECLVYATAESQCHVYANGVQIGAAVTVPAGETPVKKPLTLGTITAELRRSGVVVPNTTVTGRETVVSQPLNQDREYALASSRRPN